MAAGRRGSMELGPEDAPVDDRRRDVAVGIIIGERWTYASAYESGIVSDVLKKVPSVMTFTEEKTYFGSDGLRHSFANIQNTVYAFFGLLGRDWQDREVQELARHVTYRIGRLNRKYHSSETGIMRENIGIPVKLRSDEKPVIYTPIQLVSEFLKFIIGKIEKEIRCEVWNVAISLPSTFTQKQRHALLMAAKFIKNVRLVSSALACAVYARYHLNNTTIYTGAMAAGGYGSSKKLATKNTLVIDVSHQACSLAIIQSKAQGPEGGTDVVRVHAAGGMTSSGLGTVLNRMSTLVVEEFVEQYQNYHDDISGLVDGGDRGVTTALDAFGQLGPPPATIRATVDEQVARGKAERREHKKKLSMADRILNQASLLAGLEFGDEDVPGADKSGDGGSVAVPGGAEAGTEQELLVSALIAQSGSTADGPPSDDEADKEPAQPKPPAPEKTIDEKKQDEAMKCRFRSRMICANVLEHLHDRYQRNISLHYDGFYAGYSLHLSMKLETLEKEIIFPFVQSIEQLVDKVLEESESRISADTEFQVILSGDGANVPSVTQQVSEYFDIEEHFLKKPIVPRGCALICAVDQSLAKTPIAFDTLYASMKMANPGDPNLLVNLISQNTPTPCKKEQKITTPMDNMTEMRLFFYEGEGIRPQHCSFVAGYDIRGFPERPAGETVISLMVNVDRNSLLLITAEDVTDPENPITLTVAKGQ